jgi:hypothetical protein
MSIARALRRCAVASIAVAGCLGPKGVDACAID